MQELSEGGIYLFNGVINEIKLVVIKFILGFDRYFNFRNKHNV